MLGACAWQFAQRGDATRAIAPHLAVFGAAFAAYLLALHAAARLELRGRGLHAALLLALAWRGLLVPAPPLLSDDVYRYVWEGRVQRHGGNPYAWSDRPEAARFAHLRDPAWERMNHRDYTAIYPPLWQLAARATSAVHDSVAAFKVLLVGCEALGWLALIALLRARGLPEWRVLIAAWSPLALVEIAGSAHLEPAATLFLPLALLALARGRAGAAALALGAGALVKLLPGLVALAWLRRFRTVHALAPLALAAAVTLPFLDAGGGLVRSAQGYAAFWRFNETGFALLTALAGETRAPQIAAVLALLLALGLGWRGVEPARAALAVVAAFLLLGPSSLPWYALWLLPLLVVVEAPALLLLTGTIALAYLALPGWQSGEAWQLPWAWRALEYGPCAAVAAVQGWRVWAKR